MSVSHVTHQNLLIFRLVYTYVFLTYIIHFLAAIFCNWDHERLLSVTEEVNSSIELSVECRGRYSSPVLITVFCVPNDVPGFVTPGLTIHNDDALFLNGHLIKLLLSKQFSR